MNFNKIIEILRDENQPVITVFGDFCLDKYLYVDAERDELSLETDLTAFQITHKRLFAGAGGTITNNLLGLGAKVYCVGIVGNDGEGYELLKCLEAAGADISLMIQTDERHTNTYIKPMRTEKNHITEMNRFDIKNFTAPSEHLQRQLIENLMQLMDVSHAVIICDQYIEPDCAAVTKYVRHSLSDLAGKYNNIIWYVDSRKNIQEFNNMILKCNHKEISQVFNVDYATINPDAALDYSKILYKKNGKPVYVTLGEYGSVVYDGTSYKMPAFEVTGEIDVVGAGDACNAGIVFALAKGADYMQAGFVGNAASSIVIKMIGETGTASLDEVIRLITKADK